MRETVLSEVLALQQLSLPALRSKYLELFPQDQGIRANKACLQRRIAYRLQELAFGGLSQQAQEQLQRLAAQPNRLLVGEEATAGVSEQAKASLRRLSRRGAFLPGTVLTKVYKGQPLQVRVVEQGFEYQGTHYTSLTALAKAITGAHWNGRAFFGV